MIDDKRTPSFFSNEETFKKYLGSTSYYAVLRYAVKKLIRLTKPNKVVELGSATGATTLMLAKNFQQVNFFGSDIREGVVKLSRRTAEKLELKNAFFDVADMCDFAKEEIDAEFIFLLYSFHHILDPISVKKEFLSDMFKSMKEGAYLCIAETFLPEKEDNDSIGVLWRERSLEGNASTFWKSLSGLSAEKIKHSKEIALYCQVNEALAGGLVEKRDNEYLVKRSWLVRTGKEVGFSVILDQSVNVLGDGVVLLQKTA